MQEEKEEKRLNNKKRKTRMPVHQQRKCPDYWIIQTIENDMAEVRKLLQEYDEKELKLSIITRMFHDLKLELEAIKQL